MLKALELIGFKSFADKTRFDFPPGITVVVGPNGSGKSNIVDAIKWVLGEQSVKSLRGKDMVDVIFNGSASRKPTNMAEVSLTFDNRENKLGLDQPEVTVTRRVYRSGEGEYMINRQPCRLRDIKDMFAGTGVATEAYSVIEQGKVDVLLQSSPKDRRLIFEEAAGISRFKAKKLECQRRLERVDQNLLRLSDIVDEVGNRLKSVRMQATKARRYQEAADRLQALRTNVAAVDWQGLSEKINAAAAELQTMRDEVQGLNDVAEQGERRAADIERQADALEEALREVEQRVTKNREQILSLEAHVELDRGRAHDLIEVLDRDRRQAISLSTKAGDLDGTIIESRAALETAAERQRELRQRLADEERSLTTLNHQADQLRAENEQQRTSYLEQMRAGAALANEISALEAQLARSEERREKCLSRLAGIAAQREQSQTAFADLQLERSKSVDASHSYQQQLLAARQKLDETRKSLARQQRELAQQQETHGRQSERAALLAEWEAQLEGVEAGAKSVLQAAATEPQGPFGAVRGMVADLLQTSVEYAPILEAVLAGESQSIVYQATTAFEEQLANAATSWQGRVTFLPLESGHATAPTSAAEFLLRSDLPGMIGPLDRLVETATENRGLAQRLLANTWLVEDLATAVQLRRDWLREQATGSEEHSYRVAGDERSEDPERGEMSLVLTGVAHPSSYVTRTKLAQPATPPPKLVTKRGEIVWPHGAITVGHSTAASGLISRRSELRALKTELASQKTSLVALAEQGTALESQLAACEAETQTIEKEARAAEQHLSEVRSQASAEEQRHRQLDEQYRALSSDASSAAEQSQQVIQTRTLSRSRLDQLQLSLAQAEARAQENSRRLDQLEEARQGRNREALGVKVELARSEQQVENLTRQLRQFESDRMERQRGLSELREQVVSTTQRIDAAEGAILVAEQQLAHLYLVKEAFTGETGGWVAQREALRQERLALQNEAQRSRAKARKIEEKLHKRELAAEALRLERATLEDRLREDYEIELSQHELATTEEEARERTAVDEEINELRRKLTNLGGVNLEALQEADELEGRYENLSTQFQDLSKAKGSLEQIIHKINADSRRLFIETLEQVKEHFQSLFRKLFGGGRADIIMEEGVDILESGIEIVARPPGKEPRNISLLSGGEKTLTCVALLLSIFRSRPSPFCVLDEVDAALDEANIERFVGVLREFLNWTQFIVVTHSKKTMACGQTLYGVTMQESGISKRVSVRFEDVSDNGEIRITAQKQTDAESDAA
jgi:chromosome segregation protein